MMEVGVPDFDVTTFFGIVAPAGTPEPVVRLLNSTLNEGLKSAEAQALIQRLGVVSRPISPRSLAPSSRPSARNGPRAAKAIGAKP